LEYTSYPALSEEQPVLGTEARDIEVDVVGAKLGVMALMNIY